MVKMEKVFSGIAIAALTTVLCLSIRCVIFIMQHWFQFSLQIARTLPYLLFGLTIFIVCDLAAIYLFLYLGFDIQLIKFRSKNS